MSKQLNIDFNPDIYSQYGTLRAFLDEHLIPEMCRDNRTMQRQLIAAGLDMSPSQLKNKLVASDGAKFNTDDLERFITTFKTHEPIKYLISRYMYLSVDDEEEALKARLAEIQARKAKEAA